MAHGGFLVRPQELAAIACLLSTMWRAVLSQQASALSGQLVPPKIFDTSRDSTPVYLSISMSKLLSVDTVDYRFELIMDVITSWDDGRASEIWRAGRHVSFADLIASRAGLQTCDTTQSSVDLQTENYNNGNFSQDVAGAINPACREAIQNPLKDNCSRYCVPSVYPICCDAIWIPAIDISEVVAYPQERFVHDIVLPMSSQGIGDNDTAVIRQTRVHATFSSSMSFIKFPFDKHVLQVEFMAMGASYHLVASGLSRNRTTILSQKGTMHSDELARWKVTNLELVCYSTEQLANFSFNIHDPDPNDPLHRILNTQKGGSLPSTADTAENDTCMLQIHIERLHLFYGWNLIFPTLATVTMSFAVFFVDPMDIGIRLSTTTTLFLALTALQFVTNSELPTSSYLTAFHKLVILSYFVIIFISFQNLVVHYVASYEERLTRLKSKRTHKAALTGHSFHSGSTLEHTPEKDLDPGINGGGHLRTEGDSDQVEPEGGEGDVGGGSMAKENGSVRYGKISVLNPVWRSLRQGIAKVPYIASIEEHVTEGRGYKVGHTLDRVCGVLVPLIYWVAAILIFTT